MDWFSAVPKDVLYLIFDSCDLKGLFRTATACSTFHKLICNEEMYKKRSIIIWKTLVPFPEKDLVWAIQTLDRIKWKKILKCISRRCSSDRNDYGYEYNPDESKYLFSIGKFNGTQFDLDWKKPEPLRIQFPYSDYLLQVHYGHSCASGDGFWEAYWNDGERYIGNHMAYSRKGEGVMYFADGDKYEGEWKRDLRHGYGTYYFKNGDVYKGQWKKGNRDGLGTEIFSDGESFEGQWEDGVRCGQGTYKYTGGAVYEGAWDDNVRCGYGVIDYGDGEIFKGTWKNDCREGEGTMLYGCGLTYVGEWHNGLVHGKGTATWPNGYQIISEWIEDYPINPLDCIEPSIKKCLEDKNCTRKITNQYVAPQMLFHCDKCEKKYCLACNDHLECHPCGADRIGKEKWTSLKLCQCDKESCMKSNDQ